MFSQALTPATTPIALETPEVARWINEEVTIEEPHDQETAIVRFHLWPAQFSVLNDVISHRQVIVLKARQLGLSWLLICYAVWLCIYHPGQSVLVFSRNLESANEMIRRARGVFMRLLNQPTHLTVDNVTSLAWANGSRMKSFAATEDAGSAFTASLTILDEFAKMQYADKLYTSVKPTIDDGGRMAIIATAKGKGNRFHIMWSEAQKHLNNFHPIFLSWMARPDRDRDWYERVKRDAISLANHQQEYPSNPFEAFASAVGLVYGNFTVENLTDDEPDPELPIELAVDDGYIDPRATLFIQKQPNRILVFDELYHSRHLEETCIKEAIEVSARVYGWKWRDAKGEPVIGDKIPQNGEGEELLLQGWSRSTRLPEIAVVSHEAPALHTRFRLADIPARVGVHPILNGIPLVRRLICDDNERRVLQVNRRAQHFIEELTEGYKFPDDDEARNNNEKPIDANNHACDAFRTWVWLRARSF